MRCDVAIVGAGISGLACATALSRNAIHSVIFEARGVIGGRIRTYLPQDGGPAVELGAQVIHGNRNPLLDLASHGISSARSPRSELLPRGAAAWTVLHDRIVPLGALARGGQPPWEMEGKLAAEGADHACVLGSGPPDEGANRSGHGDLGDVAVGTWLERQGLSGDHLLAAAEWFRQNWAAEPEALSARGVASARRSDTTGDGEYAFEGGYQSLASELAETLDVRLRESVRTLAWKPGQVILTTGDGARTTARAAVITAPPPVVADERLTVTPMPERKAAAARTLSSGDGLCAVVTLSRAAPESAVIFDADGQGGFVRCTAGRPEVLIVAKAGAAAAVRAARVADVIGRILPRRIAAGVADVQVADWGRDPWSMGVFSYPAMGAGWAGPAWAAPVRDTLFFAGEATTAGSLPPTVHGALGSGLRAASEIVEAWGR